MLLEELAIPPAGFVAADSRRTCEVLRQVTRVLEGETCRPTTAMVVLQPTDACSFVCVNPALDGARILAEPSCHFIATASNAYEQNAVQSVEKPLAFRLGDRLRDEAPDRLGMQRPELSHWRFL